MTQEKFKQVLPEIVSRLRSVFDPCTIYLFGSCARGQITRSSDVDLLVVVPDSPLNFHDRTAAAYRVLERIGVPVDVMVYTRAEFDARASLPVSFEHSVRTNGVVLHAA